MQESSQPWQQVTREQAAALTDVVLLQPDSERFVRGDPPELPRHHFMRTTAGKVLVTVGVVTLLAGIVSTAVLYNDHRPLWTGIAICLAGLLPSLALGALTLGQEMNWQRLNSDGVLLVGRIDRSAAHDASTAEKVVFLVLHLLVKVFGVFVFIASFFARSAYQERQMQSGIDSAFDYDTPDRYQLELEWSVVTPNGESLHFSERQIRPDLRTGDPPVVGQRVLCLYVDAGLIRLL